MLIKAKVFINTAEQFIGQETTDIFVLAQTKQLLEDFFGANNHFHALLDQEATGSVRLVLQAVITYVRHVNA